MEKIDFVKYKCPKCGHEALYTGKKLKKLIETENPVFTSCSNCKGHINLREQLNRQLQGELKNG